MLVKFRTSAVYDKVCELHHGHTYDVPTGEHVTKLKVIDVSSYSVKVTMKNVPFELSNTHLERVLKCYGSVEKIITNMNDEDDWFRETLFMERTAYMRKLSTPIPPTLLINLTKTYIYFSYPNQIPTCNRCGSVDHAASNCPVADRTEKTSYVRPQERENAFQLLYTDFPDLPNSGVKSKAVDTEYGDASSESNIEILATQSVDSASANSHPVTSTDVPHGPSSLSRPTHRITLAPLSKHRRTRSM